MSRDPHPITSCPSCFLIIPAASLQCPECGARTLRTKKEVPKRVTITLTERELYLLSNGFSTSYLPDDDDEDNRELGRISAKLSKAGERLK